MTPAVSIIMPVYNTEKYLREALNTVLAQTMTDIEVLCVDDGSTDSSLDTLHEYAAKDPRVTVFTQDHQFAGAARNLGIKHAVGKYLLFLDSDDIFDPQLAAKSYARAEETSVDICVFGGERYYEDTGERIPQPHFCRADLCPKKVFSASDCPDSIFLITGSGPCNKLYRREFITGEGIEFQNLRSAEDVSFVLTAMACAKRITLLNEVLFSYRQHSASLQHTLSSDPLTFYAAQCELRNRLTARGLYEPLENAFSAFSADNCIFNLNITKSIPDFVKVYNCIRNQAIPEFHLDTLTQAEYTRAKILEIQKLSAAAYIALHGPGLRDVIKTRDPLLTSQVILERIKLHFKKDRA